MQYRTSIQVNSSLNQWWNQISDFPFDFKMGAKEKKEEEEEETYESPF